MYGSVRAAGPRHGAASPAPPAQPAPLATRAARAATLGASAALAVAAVVVVLLGTALIAGDAIGGGGGRLSALAAAASPAVDGDWPVDEATAASAEAWAGAPRGAPVD